jgi:uncharacterized protein (DUF433 family)
MTNDLMDTHGEIVGTRITVYNLLPDFLDPTVTEAYLCRLYDLSPEQVSAARAYVLNHLDTVLAQHLNIEARIAGGNPPEVSEKAKKSHAALLSFKAWLAERERAEAKECAEATSTDDRNGSEASPSFRQWFAEQQTRTAEEDS